MGRTSLRIVAVAAALLGSPAVATGVTAKTKMVANPVRKVVTLLQAMQKKVTEEGEKEKELFDKFMCYCKSSGGDLSASIGAAESKVPEAGSDIEASEGKLTQTKEDLKQAQVDIAAAKKAMAEAKAIREKEAGAFAAEKAEDEANLAAIKKAIVAIERGMGAGFLQTPAAGVLRKLVRDQSDKFEDIDAVTAFLSNDESAPGGSGDIVGIMNQMKDTMAKELADAISEEDGDVAAFKDLIAAKEKEEGALTEKIESKTKQIGELGVQIVALKDDLTDTEKGLIEDRKFKEQLEKGCGTKEAEWAEREKTRAEELVALADTIKVLNDDDALDLFKKTLPSAGAGASSFLQMQVSAKAMRDQAVRYLRHARKGANKQERAGFDFLVLALTGKQSLKAAGFEKVLKMIDGMVEVLKKEQKDDEEKKEYCTTELDQAEDSVKALDRTIADEKAAIANTKEGIATLNEEMEALTAGIKALDKKVAEATEQRKQENIEYKELMAGNGAAKELLGFAKNRLNKFYNPKLYKAPPKAAKSEGDQIAESMGVTDPTEAPAFVQIKMHQQEEVEDAPPPPPATWDAYSKKSEESTGVIAMIDTLVRDLDKEMTEAKTEEKNAQADYEALMQDSAEKRTTDSKTLADKGSAKADLEAELEAHKMALKSGKKEMMATLKHMESLHQECDWLLQNFDMRKEARSGEIDALIKAKAVLSGADYSLLQTGRRGHLRRRVHA